VQQQQATQQQAKEIDLLISQIEALNQEVIASKIELKKFQNAFYYHEDQYAIAYGEQLADNGRLYTRFYFMDKAGKYIPGLGTWDKATQFDKRGLARVEVDKEAFLLTTTGKRYPVVTKLADMEKIQPAKYITALDLRDQFLEQLDTNIFQYPQLKCLLLNNNLLRQIPSGLQQLKNLEYLDLSNNDIKAVPAEIGALKKLKLLLLNGNELTQLPAELGELTVLKHLNISRQSLKQLPSFIGKLSSLKELEAQRCKLENLPKEIGQLKNLRRLDLSMNRLTTLPEAIGGLEQLEEMSVESNLLKTLPTAIGNLSQLRTLRINHNRLKELPASIGQLKRVENLWASKNHLSTIPSKISGLESVLNISFRNNFLTSLPDEFGELAQLEYLQLDNNELAQFPAMLQQLPQLKKLSLDNNPIPETDWEELRASMPATEISFDKVFKADKASKYFDARRYEKAFALQEEQVVDKNQATDWYKLSWYALFAKKPLRAIEAAQQTLALDARQIRVETNLVLGYLLNNNWEKAKAVYLKHKGQPIPNDFRRRKWNEVFLDDIKQLEAAGIFHEDFEKVKTLLKE